MPSGDERPYTGDIPEGNDDERRYRGKIRKKSGEDKQLSSGEVPESKNGIDEEELMM